MLKFVMLLIGACVLAPIVLFALLFSIPVLPLLLVGWVLVSIIRSRRIRFWLLTATDSPLAARQLPRRRMLVAPLAFSVLLIVMMLQIKFAGFSWPIDLWLGGVTTVVAMAWWAQRRIEGSRRDRFGKPSQGVAQYDLYRLFEIERATGVGERRVLIVRELNRLMQDTLRPDPTFRATWPAVAELVSLRDQIRLLRSSVADPLTGGLSETASADHQSPRELMSHIEALETYVSRFLRLRLIGHDDLEQVRILVRDHSQLRAMQDEIVNRLQQASSVPVAG